MNYQSVIPEGWKKSIRERIAEHVVSVLADLKMEVPGFEDHVLFRSVGRGDPDELPEVHINSTPAAYFEDGEEEITSEWTCQMVSKTLTAYIHIRFPKGQQGVEPYSVFNYYLSRIQTALLSDTRLGGTCSDINERGASPQIFPSDGLLGGTLVLGIRYRHPQSDPTTLR